ncbi:hypothetical protein [Nocardioides baculatus]|uniref:Uncharacterized protein n=1 Tax=Nocardioides baculatus TaxID=2801337 RepID=A0ABS1LDN8_9ACTN|nr:hypothetical protein [Nocardioides baculatus]MBL0749789.1 hypothetical protein [Nocardioides baculatus]
MKDNIRKAGQFVHGALQEAAQQGRSDYGDDQYFRGFRNAAGITFRSIQSKTDVMKEQMKSGSGLTKTEQAVFAHLNELLIEIEAECNKHWAGTGLDWRPRPPVVKGPVGFAARDEQDD